ncbi:MAG: immunity protein Imm5, partial [Gracilibacteraceae bacterium]|nr:immunity protein Imm5 [Gracilibacteraceae bacterium]
LYGSCARMGNINDKLNCLQNRIDQNGHLPLCYRVNLMRSIQDPCIINKIMLECAKKAYMVWQEDYPGDTILADILHRCNAYLYQNKHDKHAFRSLADKNINYVEAGTDHSNNAGISIIALCYSIKYLK